MAENKKNIAVIGGGISGLSVSVLLSLYGFKVFLFEKSDKLGGKMNEIKKRGYRFDTGPSLFTLPDEYIKLFEKNGKNIVDLFEYRRIENICKYFYPDGSVINAYSDPDLFARELHKFGEGLQRIKKYLHRSEVLYNLISNIFIFNSIHVLKTYTENIWNGIRALFKLDAHRSFHTLNRKSFKSDKTVQLFDRYATYNGSDPYRAPATLKVISHLENNLGAFFPKKGMYAIARSLEELCKQQGVKVFRDTEVKEIVVINKQATHVLYGEQNMVVDAVVNATDISVFYNRLVKGYKIPGRVKKAEPSTSAIVFYWGIKNEFPQLELHNILFSADYKKEFTALFKTKEVYHDPTVYLFISSKEVKEDAPKGCENWFVMINAPANYDQNWEKVTRQAKQFIVQKINNMLKINIEDYIETEEFMNPQVLEEKTGSYRGSIYGMSSNSVFSAFNRHPNFSRKFKNIYFTGGSVHPGGGIPLCIASANIVARKIVSDYQSGKI